MRDFGLASHTPFELQQLQRSFLSILITGIDDKTGSEKEVAEWSKYAATHLSYHVSQALQTPYKNDELACRLLVHKSSGVALQVVAGSQRADMDELSTHLFERKQYWLAANLNKNLAFISGLSKDERCTYMLAALDALEHVPKESQPGALGLQLRISGTLHLHILFERFLSVGHFRQGSVLQPQRFRYVTIKRSSERRSSYIYLGVCMLRSRSDGGFDARCCQG